MDKKIKRTKIVVDNVGRKSLPIIARRDVEKDYISKDKIRAKIDKLKQEKYNVNSPHCGFWYELKIETLVELLEKE